jgi:hypothetical protein
MAFKKPKANSTPWSPQQVQVPEYNPNIISSKRQYVHHMVKSVRDNGDVEFWVLNKTYYEIYHFKATQISEFDVNIDLDNALAEEHIMSMTFVLHMKDKILELLEEVPGKVYLNRFECYRDLYKSLHEKFENIKSKSIKAELIEKIEYIEEQFPELLL